MLHKFSVHKSDFSSNVEEAEIRPLSLWQSLFAFAIPALLMAASFHWAMPLLQSMNLTIFESIVVAHTVPMALLLTASLVMFHKVDGFPLTKESFSQRFRFPRLTVKAAVWGMGVFIVAMFGYGLFNVASVVMLEQGWLSIPSSVPAFFDPQVTMSASLFAEMVGGQIVGNWSIIVLYSIMLFFNVVGEELWWRGYILPRQEVRYGRFAWVWHGLLWTSFHLFKWWDLLGLLPVCLVIAYVSQRTQNNWPALIAHFLFNGLGLLVMMIAVAGM